jgi:hypothetical protein
LRESSRRRFEDGFDDVVLIATIEDLDVKVAFAMLHKRMPEMLGQLVAKVPIF